MNDFTFHLSTKVMTSFLKNSGLVKKNLPRRNQWGFFHDFCFHSIFINETGLVLVRVPRRFWTSSRTPADFEVFDTTYLDNWHHQSSFYVTSGTLSFKFLTQALCNQHVHIIPFMEKTLLETFEKQTYPLFLFLKESKILLSFEKGCRS